MKRIIPGVGPLDLEHLVLDFNGTIAVGGRLLDGVAGRLRALAGEMEIHVITADTFGSVRKQLSGLPVTLDVIGTEDQRQQKEDFVRSLNGGVCVLGNGANDTGMLRVATLSIGVLEAEGMYAGLLTGVDVLCRSGAEALDLLLLEGALEATLRR